MTKEYLEEIKIRLSKSSPGNWITQVEGRDEGCGSHFIMTGVKNANDYLSKERGDDIEFASGFTINDQDFIANARQDIPLLIAEVERLQN